MPSSNTQRTLKALKDEGRVCGIVERRIHQANIRIDLFNFIDIITICPKYKVTVGVQSCGSDFKAHIDKIMGPCRDKAILWLKCNNRIQVYGWRKLKLKRGGKAMRWRPRIKEITMDDFK